MPLPYNPAQFPRELAPHYIPADEREIKQMLEAVDANCLDELFSHIDEEIKFSSTPAVGKSFEYEELATHLEQMSKRNRPRPCFIGDGLKSYQIPSLCSQVAQIRGLTTAYTPYQPERSQGTLTSLWLYSSALSQLTGFEVINASLYDRATCLFEAIVAAKKTQRRGHRAIICGPIFPGDREVLETMAKETSLEFTFLHHHPRTGRCDLAALQNVLVCDRTSSSGVGPCGEIFGVVYSQINALGLLEEVDSITSLVQEEGLQTVAIIDPVLLSSRGLKAPSEFGPNGGPDFIVGEGQHLCSGANFGGPGLGIFGMRFPGRNKTAIRNAPGRLVGLGQDIKGRPCKSIVLSTREQHIRREKATSNICSNQSFMATLAGATLLAKGDEGLGTALTISRKRALSVAQDLCRYQGVRLTYPTAPFWNEFVVNLGRDCDQLIALAQQHGLHLGANVSQRVADGTNDHLMIFCNDLQTESDLEQLRQFFAAHFKPQAQGDHLPRVPELPAHLLRQSPLELPQYCEKVLLEYYQELGQQNIGPDDGIYPLGSCTMKYNPHLNDYTASLPHFTQMHPQAPEADCQGSLQVLFEIQEIFKGITGLDALTTQPVAGAQGELVGLKMFQAYHRDRGEKRDVLLIPRSAHGTNPATATVAGFKTLVLVDALEDGLIDLNQLRDLVEQHRNQLCGIMMTNPNTSGVFEQQFKEVAEVVHSAGGLVYMDGANMNAIASWVNLKALGVDAVHNNLHKTWSIPHGGGGPGDAIVAVEQKLADYLPGIQVVQRGEEYRITHPPKSIGQFHRHFGNFAHKVRALTYLKRLGSEGIRRMSGVATLASRYLYHQLRNDYSTLPKDSKRPVMHEFILTLSKEEFDSIERIGIPKAQIIPRVGKLFLDYGLHAPTVAFPEQFGLMVEPTESFSKKDLDRFIEVARSIKKLITQTPQVLHTVPHFTPIDRVDEVAANRQLQLKGGLKELPPILKNRILPKKLAAMEVAEIAQKIVTAHNRLAN